MFGLSLQIYTDWANHYLAKSGCQRLIKDLSQDITDGVLLAQIIQIIGRNQQPISSLELAQIAESWIYEQLDLCCIFPGLENNHMLCCFKISRKGVGGRLMFYPGCSSSRASFFRWRVQHRCTALAFRGAETVMYFSSMKPLEP